MCLQHISMWTRILSKRQMLPKMVFILLGEILENLREHYVFCPPTFVGKTWIFILLGDRSPLSPSQNFFFNNHIIVAIFSLLILQPNNLFLWEVFIPPVWWSNHFLSRIQTLKYSIIKITALLQSLLHSCLFPSQEVISAYLLNGSYYWNGVQLIAADKTMHVLKQ